MHDLLIVGVRPVPQADGTIRYEVALATRAAGWTEVVEKVLVDEAAAKKVQALLGEGRR